ncbi:hypothetical protein, partial [Paenibacillus sp. FSL H8-0548]|uniref:hypothetical protein n=1 Tax=Paenibacillus sp. FSL H8-0548 TaxID=1920422 RepID=UPI001C4AA3AE
LILIQSRMELAFVLCRDMLVHLKTTDFQWPVSSLASFFLKYRKVDQFAVLSLYFSGMKRATAIRTAKTVPPRLTTLPRHRINVLS